MLHFHTHTHTHTHPHRDKATAESSASALQEQKNSLATRVTELEGEVRKLRQKVEEEQEKGAAVTRELSEWGVCVCVVGGGGELIE